MGESKNRDLFLIIGALAVLFVVLLFLLKAPKNNNNQNPSNNEITSNPRENKVLTTIEILDTGFKPKEITVNQGTQVSFVNNGNNPHWPSSEVHSNNLILSNFQASKELKKRETYKYIFTMPGIWPCRDNLNPSFKCVVIVK